MGHLAIMEQLGIIVADNMSGLINGRSGGLSCNVYDEVRDRYTLYVLAELKHYCVGHTVVGAAPDVMGHPGSAQRTYLISA